jgi:hypothetical protein
MSDKSPTSHPLRNLAADVLLIFLCPRVYSGVNRMERSRLKLCIEPMRR